MPFSWRAMRFIRAKGEGVAEIRVRGSEDMVVVLRWVVCMVFGLVESRVLKDRIAVPGVWVRE